MWGDSFDMGVTLFYFGGAMSQRGSFCTEYIYCEKCYRSTLEILEREMEYVKTHEPAHIISGKVSGLYANEEVHIFQNDILPMIRGVVCHNVRLVVIPEDEDAMFCSVEPLNRDT